MGQEFKQARIAPSSGMWGDTTLTKQFLQSTFNALVKNMVKANSSYITNSNGTFHSHKPGMF